MIIKIKHKGTTVLIEREKDLDYDEMIIVIEQTIKEIKGELPLKLAKAKAQLENDRLHSAAFGVKTSYPIDLGEPNDDFHKLYRNKTDYTIPKPPDHFFNKTDKEWQIKNK